MLKKPEEGKDYTTTAPPMVQLLPVTMGYSDPSESVDAWKTTPIEHWWPIDDTLVAGDADWWEKRLIAGPALTDPDYPFAPQTDPEKEDWYDRRHLITTLNSDDVLRRQRDEAAIQDTGRGTGGTLVDGSGLTDFYNILNPASTAFSANAYGVVGGTLAFNGPGLRTQFSLRDVLDSPPPPPEPQLPRGSYRRAMQLTAYYLAMIQRTSVPGTNTPWEGRAGKAWVDNWGTPAAATEALTAQLRTAAQLAVNTIDFADQDPSTPGRPMPSYFAWPDTATPSVEVVGVERQPYLTEAYARLVYATTMAGVTRVWDIASVESESTYAVELYNPYDKAINLEDFEIWVAPNLSDGFPETQATKHVTFSGVSIPAYSYLVISNKGAVDLGIDGVLIDDENNDGEDDYRKIQPPEASLTITHDDNVALIRRNIRNLNSVSTPPIYVMVDLLRPVILPDSDSEPASVRIFKANPDNWVSPAPDQNALNALSRQPADENDRLVWGDSSLQRHKEVPGEPPRYWHFTLACQWLFPLQVEVTDEAGTTKDVFYGAPWQFSTDPSGQQLIDTTLSRPMQHSLFGTGPNPTTGSFSNQLLVERDSLSLPVVLSFPNPNTTLTEPVAVELPTLEEPLAPFPVLCPDDPLKEIAFPTTGTLLLVTRYAHTPDGPVSVAATKEPYESNRLAPALAFSPAQILQMLKLDNGHLPIFDTTQKCKDLEEKHGRCDFPWGRLVFDYFTALPLEQLTWPLENLLVTGYPPGTRMIDLTSEAEYDQVYATAFPGYPIISRVAASSSLGAKVRGRININAAPWWVLDGLPMLAEPAELPVVELNSSLLDPADLLSDKPASLLMDILVDDATSPTPPSNWTTASPVFAKTMVAHREMRQVYNASGQPEITFEFGEPDAPGFVSVGGLCDLVSRVGLKDVSDPQSQKVSGPLPTLRNHTYQLDNDDPNTTYRPFGYIGYLQLVAPVVRLQDWVTTRNHAFTIYGSISTTTDPAIHLRMQTTVDRSPCLYGGTATTIVTEPTGYYNALED